MYNIGALIYDESLYLCIIGIILLLVIFNGKRIPRSPALRMPRGNS